MEGKTGLTRRSLVGLPALLLLPTLSLLKTLDISELLPVEVRRAKTSMGFPGVWISFPRWNWPRLSDQGEEGGGELAMICLKCVLVVGREVVELKSLMLRGLER